MLDALAEVGTVSIDRDLISLAQTSYQPLAGSEDQLAYLAHNLADHVAAATDNVIGHTPPHFERAVHYAGLTDTQIARAGAFFYPSDAAQKDTRQ